MTMSKEDQIEGITQDTTLLKPIPFDGIDQDEREEIENINKSLSPVDPRNEHHEDQIEGITQDSLGVSETTLLKPIPFDVIDKDEREEIENINKSVEPVDPHNEFQIYYQDLFMLVGTFLGNSGLEVGPVLDVIYIAICHRDGSNWKGLEIYGDVLIVDDTSQASFCVYQRKFEDAEAVFPDDNDAITISRCPIALVMKGKVIFNLIDKTNNICFSGTKAVDFSILDDDVKDKVLTVEGEGGYYVEMLYTMTPFAQIAKVRGISLFRPTEPNLDSVLSVQGSIEANNISFLEDEEFKVENSSTENYTDYCVNTFRDVFAVPAYSRLVVYISLDRDGSEFINLARASSPYGVRMCDTLGFRCNDGKHCFNVYVSWKTPAEYFGLFPQVIEQKIPEGYVEVFSIYFGGGDPIPKLYGSIVIRDPKETVYIFSRNHNFPDTLSASNKDLLFRRSISLVWPDSWVLQKAFFMHLKLKDKYGNRVSRGCIGFSQDGASYPSKFDRRICEVISGENGHFAAVHYSIFRNGLRATVTVVCEGPCNSFGVYGVIYGEYNNYDYSSIYDQNYYRIIIFNRPEEYRAKVETRSEIPLSKSKITAPSDCSYITVYVDLTIRPNMASSDDTFAVGKLRFDSNGIECTKPLLIFHHQERVGCLRVKVDWSL